MYNKHLLKKFLPGGINDGGGWEIPSGFGMGIGSTSSGTYPYSQQAKQDEIFAAGMGLGPKPSAIPKSTEFKSDNPFEFITATGTGSYAETKDTGTTVDANGNAFQNWTPPAKTEPTDNDSDLVIQEKRNKRIGAFGGEEFVNAFNMGLRTSVGIGNRIEDAKNTFNLQLDNADITKQVGTTNEIDQGDQVDIGSLIGFRTPEQGNDRNSRATFGNYAGDAQNSKLGGFMQEGGSSGLKIGQEVEMQPWELEQFLAAGGEVDYI